MSDPKPSFPDAEVLARLKAASGRGLGRTRNGRSDLMENGYDLQGACEEICRCTESHLDKHELSQNYPEFNDYIVVLKVDLPDKPRPFYVKVALFLPELEFGELMSFHEWGMKR